MKILDRYIFTTFLKTFGSIFTILLLIFILQTVWLLISDLAGKDLDLPIIGKFLIYLTPTLIPMVLPLTILLTSIMIFGNFAENYEFAAMKSSGISLQRAMKSLSIFIVLLSIVAFFFANNAIPWSEFKFRNLRRNIAQENPAMAIAEGQFNEIDDKTNIKVDRKYGEDERMLENVTMHLLRGTKNAVVIKAKRGELNSSKSSNILQLILYDGNYYEDIQSRNPKDRNKHLHAKSHFEKYTMNIDLSTLNNVDYEKESIKNNYLMLNSSQLVKAIDSLSVNYNEEQSEIKKRAYSRLNLTPINNKVNDSTKQKLAPKQTTEPPYTDDVLELFRNTRKDDVLKLAISSVNSTIGILEAKESTFKIKRRYLNKHEMSLHKKFVLGLACIILFFIGAPIGAIIRKGGFGLPIVFAIIIFIAYHFIGIFAENSAEDGSIHPFIASWLSTAIMLPFGILLTRNATRDRGVFNTDVLVTGIINLVKKITSKKKKGTVAYDHNIHVASGEEFLFKSYLLFKGLDKERLIQLVNEVQFSEQLINKQFVFPIYQVNEQDNTYLIHLPLKHSNDYITVFDTFSDAHEQVQGYWNISNSALEGDTLMFVKKYGNLLTISNLSQAYRIGDQLQFKKSENREKIVFEPLFIKNTNCQHVIDLGDDKQVVKRYIEQDPLLLNNKGTIGIASIIFLNIITAKFGQNATFLFGITAAANALGLGYFIYSIIKRKPVISQEKAGTNLAKPSKLKKIKISESLLHSNKGTFIFIATILLNLIAALLGKDTKIILVVVAIINLISSAYFWITFYNESLESKAPNNTIDLSKNDANENDLSLEELSQLNDKKLIDIHKNYRQYGYSKQLKVKTLKILNNRGITEQQLRFTGDYENFSYEEALKYYNKFNSNSKRTLIFWSSAFIMSIGASFISIESNILAICYIVILFASVILFYFYLVRTMISNQKFYKTINKKQDNILTIIFTLGIVFYILSYIYSKNKMEEEMKSIQ